MGTVRDLDSEAFVFPHVYISYEGEAELPEDAGWLTFSDVLEEFDGGNWFVANSVEATLAFTGYPAKTYSCRRATRKGPIDFLLASTGYTNVHGRQIELTIEVESAMTLGDVQIAQRVQPALGSWGRPIEEWRRFGPNGKQVAALVDWWRTKIDQQDLPPLERVRELYKERADLRWPSYPPMGSWGSSPPMLRSPGSRGDAASRWPKHGPSR